MFTRHRIFTALAALLVVLGFAFGPASAARAADTTQWHQLTPLHDGHNLDVEGASTANGARIVQWYVSGNANQLWVFQAVPGTYDTYYIRSKSSGKVLSVNSYVAGAPVIQWINQSAATQQWQEIPTAGGSKFRNVATGLYLDVQGSSYAAGAPLVQWYGTNGLNQIFTIY